MKFVAKGQVCVTSEHDCCSLDVGENILLLLIMLKRKKNPGEVTALFIKGRNTIFKSVNDAK